tara:strand:+ start:2516 stop:3490 length:975 start_codon:yes stop_codon:yes gene_type:complete
MTINGAIVILTQNTIERKIYLKNCLYFLFENFNSKFKYPIIILHEGDYYNKDKQEILSSVRINYRNLISFTEIDKTDFKVPDYIDENKLNKLVNLQIVPYWRNIKYRLMCNFWINHFTKYTKDYDYIMRLDDDSIIEEPINIDLFELLKNNDKVYLSNIVHIDCGLCNFRMKELFNKIFPNSSDKVDNLFIKTKIQKNSKVYTNVKKFIKELDNIDIDDDIELDMPIMFYNNFFITDINFWKRQDVKDVITEINKNGNIFYCRYGDAPLQTLIVNLLEPDKITRSVFKYSKRLQRECFIDSENNLHSYMPGDYNNSSCIFDKKK